MLDHGILEIIYSLYTAYRLFKIKKKMYKAIHEVNSPSLKANVKKSMAVLSDTTESL